MVWFRATAFAAFALAASFSVSGARAQSAARTYVPVTYDCVMQAASLQRVPYQIVLGFLKTEGGKLGSEVRNMDGSYDLGPMQINDRTWLSKLAQLHFRGDVAAARESVRDNGCYNVNVGMWIYKQYVDEADGNLAEAVGYYNSHTPVHKQAYQRRFASAFLSLFGNKR